MALMYGTLSDLALCSRPVSQCNGVTCLLDGRVFLFKLKMPNFKDKHIDGVSDQFENECVYRVRLECLMLHVDSNLKFRYIKRVDQRRPTRRALIQTISN